MLQALVLSLLVGQLPMPQAPVAHPDWIDNLPDIQGRLYGLGMAELGSNQGQALARASVSARLEVVTRIRTSVKRQTSTVTRTSELAQGDGGVAKYGDRHTRNATSVTAQAEDLPGLVVERTFVDAGGRTAYALAYLDLGQAQKAMASGLTRLQERRGRVGTERSLKARWALRKLKGDLDRLDETMGLLAPTGVGQELAPKLQAERTVLDSRLAALDNGNLPPLDFSKLAVAIRSNVDLPSGLSTYLKAQIEACGLVPRDLAPDLIVDLKFKGGDNGPEFIYTNLDVYQGVTYQLEAEIKLLEQGGEALGQPAPLHVVQSESPDGMVREFRRQIERRLPKLFADFRSELQ